MFNDVGIVDIPLNQRPEILLMAFSVHGAKQKMDKYHLQNIWCLHCYEYRARLRIGDDFIDIRPDSFSLIPANVALEYYYKGPSRHAFAHFVYPPDSVTSHRMPCFFPNPSRDIVKSFREGVEAFSNSPVRANVRLWDILWRLFSDHGLGHSAQDHSELVRRAMAYLEVNISRPISINEVAEHCEVSHNHLTRMFRKETGLTVVGYLRNQRVARAVHLLRNTSMRIQQIADDVGIPDAQYFNKTVRALTRLSPKRVRSLGPVKAFDNQDRMITSL